MAASCGNKILSSVHLLSHGSERHKTDTAQNRPFEETVGKTYLSRFFFNFPRLAKYLTSADSSAREYSLCQDHTQNIEEDEDGDQMLLRKSYDTNCDRSEEKCHCADSHHFIDCHDINDRTGNMETQQAQHHESSKSGVKKSFEVLTIEHHMETMLQDVGFQVWSGALLLSDYLLHHRHQLAQCTVLDLGAGLGFTSLTASMVAQRVICTDYSIGIVRLAERNWHRNSHLLPGTQSHDVIFKVFDWTLVSETGTYMPADCSTNTAQMSQEDNSANTDQMSQEDNSEKTHQMSQEDNTANTYQMSQEDWQLVQSSRIILAAEVIYDDAITDAFFKTLYHILCAPPTKHVFLALEKRVVFSLGSRQICSPAYDQFTENLCDLDTVDAGPIRFSVETVDTSDIPQYFSYTRNEHLELWKISTSFVS